MEWVVSFKCKHKKKYKKKGLHTQQNGKKKRLINANIDL